MPSEVAELYPGETGVILGTGPSLAAEIPKLITLRQEGRVRLFGLNNTFQDFPILDCHVACDPHWWAEFGSKLLQWRPGLAGRSWHWDPQVCRSFGLNYIEGRWGDGLSLDRSWIHYGHSSGMQALGLARHMGCDPIKLVGFDMHYQPGAPRHYFRGLSDQAGEYPSRLRKFSSFDGLLEVYELVARQPGLPRIINCTPGSALTCFEMGSL